MMLWKLFWHYCTVVWWCTLWRSFLYLHLWADIDSLWGLRFFNFPPARFMVRCVADPFKPSFLAVFLKRRLVLDPESNIASTARKFPFLFMTFTFWTGSNPVTDFNCRFYWYTAFSWTLLQFCVTGTSRIPLWNGAAFGFNLVMVSFALSLCRDRWWFFLHLSQVEPSGFLHSFVWSAVRHFWYLQYCLTIPHFWLTVIILKIGQAARWCFALQLSGHVLSSVSSPSVVLFSAFFNPFLGDVLFVPQTLLLLPQERMLVSWCNQAIGFLTFSSLPSLLISLPKCFLLFRSSLDKIWDIKNGASEASNRTPIIFCLCNKILLWRSLLKTWNLVGLA